MHQHQAAPSSGFRAIIKWKAELPSSPIDNSEGISNIVERGGISTIFEWGGLQMLRQRSTGTKRYDPTLRIYAVPQAMRHMRAGTPPYPTSPPPSPAQPNPESTDTGWLLSLPRRASAATTFIRDRGLQTSAAVNRHPRGGRFWAPKNGRQRLDRPGGGRHRRSDGRIVPIEDRRLQGTAFPNILSCHPGFYLRWMHRYNSH